MTKNGHLQHTFPIVGIGASAGGLEALQSFLDVLPKEFNFALVFIQHQSAKHKSLLQELLSAKRPSLVIQEISEGLKVQAGRLYLAPPGKEVRLRNGLFQTTVHPEGLLHLPIDEFLLSLAEDAGERAIAVILSGAGTDGARSCQAVRASGGTIYVQDPETAGFDSMPIAAISSGHADAVLPPGDICRELLKIQDIGAAAGREPVFTPAEYDSFFRVLLDKTGARFNHYKKSVVGRRIRRRMYLQGVSLVKDYLELVSARDTEAASLASDLMIGVTSFFRDRVAWKALNHEVVRKLTAENAGTPVRVWTPASATGEEAYSIAMMLSHELALAGKKRDIQVFATDVNDRALEKAREGIYPASISADVPGEYLQKYFLSAGDGQSLAVIKEIRECVVFAKQDLLTDPPFSRLDLIICRNFMIYLEPDAQEKCITLFHYALKQGGYLFLGNAETVGRKKVLFQTVGRKQCRVYRKLETTSVSRLPLSVPYAAERTALPAAQLVAAGRQLATSHAQEFLLEEYAPASIAIDQNYDIVYHNGPTNRYLRQPRGVPTQNALELLPEALRNRVRGAIFRATRDAKTMSIPARFPADGDAAPSPPGSRRDGKSGTLSTKKRRAGLKTEREVILRVSKIKENLFVIVFQEKTGPSKQTEAVPLDAGRVEETAMHQLESELSATRQDLQSHIEQLRSLNEELQSSNEEFQAANEELETSREELQSLNEELITVNSQLQGKIEEQDETNNDLNNFLTSTSIPTIFLDQRFRVKRFTPAMSKLLKLIPTDVGRPIIDMSQEGLGPDLIADTQAVLESLVAIRKEMLIGGAWYIRAVLPYRTGDNRIEGVVITYTDITELKRAEEQTRHLASFPQLNPNPVLEINASGKVIFSNPATQRILESLGMDKDDVHAFLPTDIDSIRKGMTKREAAVHYREIVLGDRVFGAAFHHVPQFDVVRIYAYEITERKRAEEALRKSEELFRLAVDNMPDSLSIYDEERRYVFVNSAGLRRAGKPLDEFVGRRIDDMYDEKTLSAFMPALMKTYETRAPQTIETEITMPTGQYYLVITFVPMLKEGKVYQVLGFTFDITDRRRADELTGRLAALVASADDAIISKDLNGVVKSWNIGAEKIFGWLAGEAVGRNISFLVPPGQEDEVPGIIERIVRGEHVEHYESVRMRKDGTIVPVALTFSAIKDGAGKIIGISKVAHDITERKRVEETLRESEERFRLMGETVPYGAWMADAEGRNIYISPLFLKLVGKTFDQVKEFGWMDKMPPEDVEPVTQRWLECVRTGNDWEGELRFLLPDGRVNTILSRGKPLRNPQGQIVAWVGINLDITERKRADEEIRRRVEELRQTNEELARFNRAMEGRELRMIELKKETNELCKKAGLPPRYRVDFGEKE